jgi:Ca2+/H+ antiporter, TMEM165/GDT1 family
MMIQNRIARGIMIALMATAALALFSYVVMLLWNWLVPQIFGWRHITYWQALGLLVLSKILFGGFRGGRQGHGGKWPRKMRERWEQMTPEEREKFRKGMMGCMMSKAAPSDDIAPSASAQTAER